MIKSIRLIAVFTLCSLSTFSQVSFYAATFKGGVTGGGYAPDYDGSGGTGTINVYIEPGSTIHKAYLFAGSEGVPNPLTVTLNSTALTFDNTNAVSPVFQSPFYGGNSTVHAIDVTSVVSASVTSYSLTVPALTGPSDIFFDFYLYIAYDNASLPSISTEFFVNNQDFGPDVTYNFNLTAPVNSTMPVAVGLDCGYMCSSGDADEVYLNGTDLGSIYGPEPNSGSCEGPCTNFYYQNNTAFGLSGNNADQAMNGPDVLSNAEALIPNNSTSFTMHFTHGNQDNALWGFFIVSGGSCAPPIATVLPADTGICFGNFAQLIASGGTTYHWSPTAGVSDSTSANPTIFPAATTTYTVTVSNGCASATAVATIAVFPTPPTPIITPSNDTLYCSFDPSYKLYQWYFNDTIIPGASAPLYFATQSGNYNVAVTDTNGCLISVGINITITGISPHDDYTSGAAFTIYPDPVGNKLYVDNFATCGSCELTIYNVLGQVVLPHFPFQRGGADGELDVSSLPPGLYFIRSTSNEAEGKIWISRFVKE